jgi:hypothetical protein
MRLSLWLVIFILSPTFLFAQFNDTTNFYVNYTSTGILNKTSEGSSFVFNNAVKFNVYKRHISLNTFNQWIYGEQRNDVSNNDFHSVIDLNLFKGDRNIYTWALANYETSYSLQINYRLQTGIGIGYYLVDKDNFVVQISDGILYERSDLYDAEKPNDDEVYRNSLRLKLRWHIREIFTIETSDFYQPSINNWQDYIMKSHTTLSMKLKKWLHFTVALNYNKLSVTNRENLLFNFGFTAEDYF